MKRGTRWNLAATLGTLGALLLAGALRAEEQTVSLDAVLRLAGSRSLPVELARERVREAKAGLEHDRLELFPWLSPGVGYRRHDGNLQDVAGNVFDASKQSGTAAVTVQAQLELGDSIYRVLASRQSVRGSESAGRAVQRGAWVSAATAYYELARAEASIGAAEESVRIAGELLREVREAVEAGLAFAGEVPRAEVLRDRAAAERVRAVEARDVAAAALAIELRLPPDTALRSTPADFLPVMLVETNRPLQSLVAGALAHRPELAQQEAGVAGARARRDGAVRGPWIPSLGAQASLGGLAGGRNGDFGHADDFADYGVGLSWRIGPGGIGDRTRVDAAESRLRQAELQRERVRDGVIREVVEARSRAWAAAEQLGLAERTLRSARRLEELSRGRREFGVGVVLEVVDAERELVRARLEHLRLVAEHNRRQWEFWQAVGDDEPSSVVPPSKP